MWITIATYPHISTAYPHRPFKSITQTPNNHQPKMVVTPESPQPTHNNHQPNGCNDHRNTNPNNNRKRQSAPPTLQTHQTPPKSKKQTQPTNTTTPTKPHKPTRTTTSTNPTHQHQTTNTKTHHNQAHTTVTSQDTAVWVVVTFGWWVNTDGRRSSMR